MRQSQADLALQRAHDELAHLRAEIEKELGLVALTRPWTMRRDRRPSMNWSIASRRCRWTTWSPGCPRWSSCRRGWTDDVRNLRAQIGRLGPVNLDALAEYNEVEARYNFLTTQAADLEHAVASLEEVIAELDQVMEREFLATFKAIAGKFKDEFSTLFGGGAAKLVLTDPDSPNTTGVEIIARPPGKREQGLALLSGGERTLTAAALIFSILKTRPTPFCVLDEVDAALDEANVGRFRDALKALTEQTQFILITHNRGTIEAADTIYGVSMGADNTSQVLSLKLDGHESVPATLDEARLTVEPHRLLPLYLLALGTVILWGASFPLTKAALDYLGPTTIAFLRWTISSGGADPLAGLAAQTAGRALPDAAPRWPHRGLGGADRDHVLLLSGEPGAALHHGHECRGAVQPHPRVHGAHRHDLAGRAADRRRVGRAGGGLRGRCRS